jgi:hypothetical protein
MLGGRDLLDGLQRDVRLGLGRRLGSLELARDAPGRRPFDSGPDEARGELN